MAEVGFHDLCTRCGDCARACPERIIGRGRDGLPVIDASAGACTFCAACIDVCETGALRRDVPWRWRAEAGGGCLSTNGVFCRTCEDHCGPRAIPFRLAPGGRSAPQIDLTTCTGCGRGRRPSFPVGTDDGIAAAIAGAGRLAKDQQPGIARQALGQQDKLLLAA